MALIDLDDGTWTIDALKAALKDHAIYKHHGMAMPTKILLEDLKRAARLFDQHDPSTTIADGKISQPLAYGDRYYTINGDLRPMAEAAGMRNTHGKEFSNGGLARRLNQWDVDNAPRIAAFLPRSRKEEKLDMPKRAVQTQQKAESEPPKSKKCKAVSTNPPVPAKRQQKAIATPEDDGIDIYDQNESHNDDYRPQPRSTQILRRKQTYGRKAREDQASTIQTHLDTNKVTGDPACMKLSDDKEGDPTDAAAIHIDGDDDEDIGLEARKLQESGTKRRGTMKSRMPSVRNRKKPTKARKAKADLNEDGTPKTAEQIAKEQLKKEMEEAEEEEKRLHNARRLGRYTDPVIAERYRVKHKTVRARLEGHIRPGVEPAPDEQLGSWRLWERYVDRAKEEGRDLELWMGGPNGPKPNRPYDPDWW
jgi:hypothetical protein